ncbi:peptidoglycan DD-metalloendopeptidase family protein [Marinilabiliaceae bacterium ANBcel2]|nr:peptidoglycan DD-metalloendopeptidase family protein [Marinilabiliaceae bacterium ANBcel2]
MKLLIFSIFTLLSVSCFSQGVDNLRDQRERLLEEIEQTNKELGQKRSTRENTYQQLTLISQEISVREKVLHDLRDELNSLDRDIESNQLEINRLEEEIEQLKDEYAQLIRDTYKRRNSLDELVFFMGANSFAESYQRYRVLKEYSRYRQQQGEQLVEKQNRLIGLNQNIQNQRQRKENNLQRVEEEYSKLEENREGKSRLIRSLRAEEEWLRQSLREKEKQAHELENRILEYIETASTGSEGIDFEDFKGRLIWPVDRGIIVNQFGEHRHTVLDNVTINNNGIDIQSLEGESIYSVHQGEVSRIVAIPGYNTAIIMRHGDYLTVYANLREVFVAQGELVGAGTEIGKVYKGSTDDYGILHFEIWNENQKLDPSIWLRN